MKINSKTPVFIGGCPRSGTTMLGSMLGSLDEAITTPESHFKQTLLFKPGVKKNDLINKKKFLLELNRSLRFKIWGIELPDLSLPEDLTLEDYQLLLVKLVETYSCTHDNKNWTYWIDHTPQNFQQATTLLKIFPNAKFIHLIRDPRAILSSVLNVDWGPVSARYASKWWAQKISYPLAFQYKYPHKTITIRYEDLVINPDKTLRKICKFSNLKFDKSMINGGGFNIPKYTVDQHKKVGGYPDVTSIDKWKTELDAYDINSIEYHIGDLMELFGYEKINISLPNKSLFMKSKKCLIITIKKLTKIFKFRKRKFKLMIDNN